MKDNSNRAALVPSFVEYLTNNAPAGVNLKVKATAEGVAVYILNAPAELIEWPELASNARRFAELRPAEATAAGLELFEQLRAIARRWSDDNNGVTVAAPIWVGSPSRGFVPVAKNTPAPRVARPAPAIRWARNISPKDCAILSAIYKECEAVAASLHLKKWAAAPSSLLEISERVGKDIQAETTAPRVVEVGSYRMECSPAELFAIAYRYGRAFGCTINPAPLCQLISAEPLAVEVEQPAAPSVEVEPLAAPSVEDSSRAAERTTAPAVVEVEQITAPAVVEVEQITAPAVSLRKACARLIVAALSLIVAGLSVMIAAARLVERGRLFEVIAAALRGRAERVQTVAARRAFVVRGRLGRAVAAVRSYILGRIEAARLFVRGRLDRVQTVAARRAFVVRGRLGRAVAAVRSSVLGRIEAVRLFVADCLFSARLAHYRRVAAIRGRAVRLITAAALFLLNLNRLTNRAAARLGRA